MRFPHGVTIIRVQPGEKPDHHGHTRPDWTHPIRTEIPGCAIYPSAGGGQPESGEVGRTIVTQQFTVLMPPGTVLNAEDRVEWAGETFNVIGHSFNWVSPFTGWNPGAQATIQRREG